MAIRATTHSPRRTNKPTSKDVDVVKMIVTLHSGAEFEAVGGRDDAIDFHRRFKKWVDGQVHKTDNHKIVFFGGIYFAANAVAVYSAEDMDGKKVDLGPAH